MGLDGIGFGTDIVIVLVDGDIMNNGLLQVLVEEDSGYVKEGRNWGRSEKHSSLVVNEEKQVWYWNSEQTGGGVLDYLVKVRGLTKKAAAEIVSIRGKILSGFIEENQKVVYGHAYEKMVNAFWSLGKSHREYWYERKLTDKTIDRYRLGYIDGWYTIPLYIGERFVNFQCRRDFPDKRIRMWYKLPDWKPVMLNPELLQLVDRVYITESPTDAILLNQEGIPTVSHTGGSGYWNPEWNVLFNRIEKIYYIADNDRPGILASERIAKSLGLYRTYIYRFEDEEKGYDAGDYFKAGGNAKELKSLVEGESKLLFEIGELNANRSRHRWSHPSLAH